MKKTVKNAQGPYFSTIKYEYKAPKTAEKSYQVPLNIHFIWMGSMISEEYVQHIDDYREINTNYTVREDIFFKLFLFMPII